MNSKMDLRKISFNEYFKAISHFFCVYSLSGLTADQCTHVLRDIHCRDLAEKVRKFQADGKLPVFFKYINISGIYS